jgi:hypothetical protein
MTARYAVGRRSIEIEILGYAHPDGTDVNYFTRAPLRDKYSLNWLNTRVALNEGPATWQVKAEVMLTWEVEALALWCERVAYGELGLWQQSGVEYTPEFEVVCRPCRPPRITVSLLWTPWINERVEVQLDADPLALRCFAAALRSELDKTPPREIDIRTCRDVQHHVEADRRLRPSRTLFEMLQRPS